MDGGHSRSSGPSPPLPSNSSVYNSMLDIFNKKAGFFAGSTLR
jgi:hypothetical protein